MGLKRWHLLPAQHHRGQEGLASANQSVQSVETAESTLTLGDLLYLPKGMSHVAQGLPATPSLHLTLAFRYLPTFEILLASLPDQQATNVPPADPFCVLHDPLVALRTCFPSLSVGRVLRHAMLPC